ncbi:hypothetical protein K440DRAFT_660792 [Wilcoxina mikolae CBS 423.85]|nr:hypothetical protein K440DRAFT_660792 [Wilcoxina mikolae CBS 423.85]
MAFIPQYLFRASHDRSQSPFTSGAFYASSQEPDDLSLSGLSRHLDLDNREPTPYISTTTDPWWALNIARNMQREGYTGVRLAVIDTSMRGNAVVVPASLGATVAADRQMLSKEYLFLYLIPQGCIISCRPFEWDTHRRFCMVLNDDDSMNLEELREALRRWYQDFKRRDDNAIYHFGLGYDCMGLAESIARDRGNTLSDVAELFATFALQDWADEETDTDAPSKWLHKGLIAGGDAREERIYDWEKTAERRYVTKAAKAGAK